MTASQASRARQAGLACLMQRILPMFGLPALISAGCTQPSAALTSNGTDIGDAAPALCGGRGEPCCAEPSLACGVQLQCEPTLHECVLEERPQGVDRLCASGNDCAAGETCCAAAHLGSCTALAAGAVCPLPDLELTFDPEYVSPAQVGPGLTGPFPPGIYVTRSIFGADKLSSEINPMLPLVDPPAAAFRGCAVQKQCVGVGLRTLLHFSVRINNIGDADLILGPAGAPGVTSAVCDGANYSGAPPPLSNPLYRTDYLLYQLLDVSGTPVAQSNGLAPAICVPAAQSTSRFSCEFLGLAKGAYETFDVSSECQWLDITGVPPGEYTLRSSVNPDRRLRELSYDNNTFDVPVSLTAPDLLAACPGPSDRRIFSVSALRDCGWSSHPPRSCAPGTLVDFGCPDCTGDTVLRVCEDTAPCTSDQALASGDDISADNFCSVTRFRCPPSGTYNWMAGSWFGNDLDSTACAATDLPSVTGE